MLRVENSPASGRNFPNYSAGFNLNVPLRKSAARADMIKNQLDYRQAEIDARQAKNAVRLNAVNARIALEQARAACVSRAGRTRRSAVSPLSGSPLSANATAISPPWWAISSQFKSAAVLGHVLFNRETCCLAFDRCVIRRLSQEFML
jgi:hypothetical protein